MKQKNENNTWWYVVCTHRKTRSDGWRASPHRPHLRPKRLQISRWDSSWGMEEEEEEGRRVLQGELSNLVPTTTLNSLNYYNSFHIANDSTLFQYQYQCGNHWLILKPVILSLSPSHHPPPPSQSSSLPSFVSAWSMISPLHNSECHPSTTVINDGQVERSSGHTYYFLPLRYWSRDQSTISRTRVCTWIKNMRGRNWQGAKGDEVG